MKWLILIVIKIYWMVFSKKKEPSCIFKETCSHYVYRKSKDVGFIGGVSAFLDRLKKCRNGYQLYTSLNGFEMELVDGSIIKEDEIAPRILMPFYKQINEIKFIETKVDARSKKMK